MSAAHVDLVLALSTATPIDRSPAEEMEHLARTSKKAKFLTADIRVKALQMMRKGDFERADALHFLAAHDHLHEQIYGVPDPDVMGPALRISRSQVQGMLSSLGTKRLTDFVRWAWKEEQRRETWRRENHRDGARMSAQRLFSRSKLTEFYIAMQRQKGVANETPASTTKQEL